MNRAARRRAELGRDSRYDPWKLPRVGATELHKCYFRGKYTGEFWRTKLESNGHDRPRR